MNDFEVIKEMSLKENSSFQELDHCWKGSKEISCMVFLTYNHIVCINSQVIKWKSDSLDSQAER